MLYQYIGDEAFRKGMSLYLNRFKYKNTQTEDLWAALGEASGKPVRDVMTTWTKQKGYPVISVSDCVDGDNRLLKLSQEKFCADGKVPDSEKDTEWMVPLTFTTAVSPSTGIAASLLASKTSEVVIPGVPASSWVKVNQDSVGVYRVQYSGEMLSRLIPGIESKTLPPLDRLNVQDDLFALVQAGKTSTVEILKLLEAFKNEDEYPVWASISSCLGRINLLLSHTNFQDNYHVWGRKLLLPIYSQLGWTKKTDDKHSTTLLRGLVLSRLAVFGEPSVVAEARKLFEAHANGTGIIPPDIRSAVYSAVARNADEKTFNTFLALYRKAETQEEKNRLSGAIAAAPETWMLERVLTFAMSDEVRSQDAAFVICYVAMNKKGRELAWSFFQDNSCVLKARYESGFLMSRLVKCITENFATEDKAREVESFFSKNPFPGTERTVQQSLENIRLNAEWLSRDADAIKTFINNFIA
jgi:puromycin-sensitive aminopeptidase